MKKSLIIAAILAAASLAVNAQSTPTTYTGSLQERVEACKSNAGWANPDEKKACIQVEVEKEIAYCKANAGATNPDEKAACIKVAKEQLQS